MKKLKSIKNYLTILVAIVLVISIIIESAKTYYSEKTILQEENLILKETLTKELDELLKQDIQNSKLEVELLLNDRAIVEKFANGDRLGLEELTLPIYEKKLRDEFGIKEFQFHTPPATSFYRVHMPDKWGDDLSSFRQTVVDANRDKKIIAGLEVGKAGLGIRLVHPINYNGQHIGSVEFGKSLAKLLKEIARANNVEFAVGIKTSVFQKAVRKAKQDDIINGETTYRAFSNEIVKKNISEIETNFEEIPIINFDDKDYAVFSIPIKDYSNSDIGIITFFSDRTAIIEEANTDLFISIFIQIISGAILIGLLLYIINKKVLSSLNDTVEFTKSLTAGNYKAVAKNTEFIEIYTLNETLNILTEKIMEQYQMIDSLPTPVMRIDKDFNIQYMNQSGANLVGVSQANLVGQKCYNNFRTEHCNTDKCAVARAMSNGKNVTEKTIARPQGKEMHIMYTGTPIYDNNGVIIGGEEYVADISEMVNKEEYLSNNVRNILEEMEKFSHGDLSVELHSERKDDDIAKLFNGFNETVAKIRDLISQLVEAVSATASASTQISASSEEMAAGAQEQSSQTSEVASAVEEMAKTIVETSINANNAAKASAEAKKEGIEGFEKLKETQEGMIKINSATDTTTQIVNSLTQKTASIGEITRVIDEIADQTNLLALNAAIEAARAGEQGRGFAVVADEVRKLAERTTKATKEIGNTIKSIQSEAKEADEATLATSNAVHQGMEMINSMSELLKHILTSFDNVTMEISQVASASEQQSATVEEISKNIEGINHVAQEAAQGVQQIAQAAEDLNRLTENLSQIASYFKIDNYEMKSSTTKANNKLHSQKSHYLK